MLRVCARAGVEDDTGSGAIDAFQDAVERRYDLSGGAVEDIAPLEQLAGDSPTAVAQRRDVVDRLYNLITRNLLPADPRGTQNAQNSFVRSAVVDGDFSSEDADDADDDDDSDCDCATTTTVGCQCDCHRECCPCTEPVNSECACECHEHVNACFGVTEGVFVAEPALPAPAAPQRSPRRAQSQASSRRPAVIVLEASRRRRNVESMHIPETELVPPPASGTVLAENGTSAESELVSDWIPGKWTYHGQTDGGSIRVFRSVDKRDTYVRVPRLGIAHAQIYCVTYVPGDEEEHAQMVLERAREVRQRATAEALRRRNYAYPDGPRRARSRSREERPATSQSRARSPVRPHRHHSPPPMARRHRESSDRPRRERRA
jgi:hypothetical protein